MKDEFDNQTTEIFEAPVKRGRGRPFKGNAKTAAERMRLHREKNRNRSDLERPVETTIKLTRDAQMALQQLAKRNNVTQGQLVAKLLKDYENAYLKGLSESEFNAYFGL